MDRELRRRRIAQLRLHHQKLIGVKIMDKKTSYNGVRINESSVLETGKSKKKTEPQIGKADEAEGKSDSSSDEEITNAVTQYPNAISLSIYDDNNLSKRKF